MSEIFTEPSHASTFYSSSLTAFGAALLVVPSNGQQSAGEVALKRYSHFSGSVMDSRALVVPHDSSIVADRDGPFQHLALKGIRHVSNEIQGGERTRWYISARCSDHTFLLERYRSNRRMNCKSVPLVARHRSCTHPRKLDE